MKRDTRMRRFERVAKDPAQLAAAAAQTITEGLREGPNKPVVGTCTTIEKRYYRLTSAPDPSVVRPQPILEQALALVLDKLKGGCEYLYACEQFKSIRQDLTVQHIQNEFTVRIYETHARVAIENDDLNEFNQCQTQLIALFARGLSSHRKGTIDEFTAYRILYFVYNKQSVEIVQELRSLPVESRQNQDIAMALRIRQVMARDDYHAFFKLRKDVQDLQQQKDGHASLMVHFHRILQEHVRLRALQLIVRAYRPHLPLTFLQTELGFKSIAACSEWIVGLGGVLTPDGASIDVVASQPHLANAKAAGSKLL